MLTSAKDFEGNIIIFGFLKLHKVLSICAKSQVFDVLTSEIK